MNTKQIIGILVVLAILIGGGVWASRSGKVATYEQTVDTTVDTTTDTTSATSTDVTSTTATSTTPATNSYTMATVAQHGSKTSCWTAINGKVYNLTTWIAQHPGGEAAILSLCDTDGTAKFTAQHGGQPQPEKTLASVQIGIVK